MHAIGKNLEVDLSSRILSVRNSNGNVLVKCNFGVNIGATAVSVDQSTDNGFHAKLENQAEFTVTINQPLSDNTVTVYDVEWKTDSLDELSDTFELSPFHWYGGAETYGQRWLVETHDRPMWTYTTSDIYKPGYGSVQERYWLSSSHVALTVDDDVPLLMSISDKRLRLLSRYLDTIYSNCIDSPTRPFLKYKLWVGIEEAEYSLKILHINIANKLFARPMDIPDERMFKWPIWTTWARYKKEISQENVLQFAQEIMLQLNFPISQFEIDDMWEASYGDLEFDKSKFPDARRMIDALHFINMRVTVWVHPFASLDSETVKDEQNRDHWVKNDKGEPAQIEWWNGVGYILDVTNKKAAIWFINRLNCFKQKYNIDSFKFDAGETNWLSDNFRLHNAKFPNQYTERYADLANSFGSIVEARCNAKNQQCSHFLRIIDKDSVWSNENGLKTLIPAALLFGLLNRPFVLPDIIGGNAYKGSCDRELFIRWTQANTFLPAMQFSKPPWEFDHNCLEIVRKFIERHENFSLEMIRLAKQSTMDGSPIVRPLWWTGDEREESLTCDNQFMFGDDILVAPVLDEKATERSVYLPNGSQWLSVIDHEVHSGGITIRQKATLDQLPHYNRLKCK